MNRWKVWAALHKLKFMNSYSNNPEPVVLGRLSSATWICWNAHNRLVVDLGVEVQHMEDGVPVWVGHSIDGPVISTLYEPLGPCGEVMPSCCRILQYRAAPLDRLSRGGLRRSEEGEFLEQGLKVHRLVESGEE